MPAVSAAKGKARPSDSGWPAEANDPADGGTCTRLVPEPRTADAFYSATGRETRKPPRLSDLRPITSAHA